MCKRLCVRRQINSCIVQIPDISSVRCGKADDHCPVFIRICIVRQLIFTAFLNRQISLYHLYTVIQCAFVSCRDVQSLPINLCRSCSASCQKKLPVLITLLQIFSLREITVDNIVACRIRIPEFYSVLRLINIRIIMISLIDSDIVYNKLRIVFKLRIFIRIAYPASAYRQIQDHIERLVIRRRVRCFSKSGFLGKPVVFRIVETSVHVVSELARLPLTCKDMEVFREILFCCRQCISTLFLCMRFTKVKRSVHRISLITQHFHDINFTALRPLTIITLVRGHHPECRQESFTVRYFCPNFKSSVFIIMLILCIDSSGCIGCTVPFTLLNCLNDQIAVLNIDVLRRIHILL